MSPEKRIKSESAWSEINIWPLSESEGKVNLNYDSLSNSELRTTHAVFLWEPCIIVNLSSTVNAKLFFTEALYGKCFLFYFIEIQKFLAQLHQPQGSTERDKDLVRWRPEKKTLFVGWSVLVHGSSWTTEQFVFNLKSIIHYIHTETGSSIRIQTVQPHHKLQMQIFQWQAVRLDFFLGSQFDSETVIISQTKYSFHTVERFGLNYLTDKRKTL